MDRLGAIVSPTSAQIRRNWIHLSWLTTIEAIGFQKPYDKSESGMNLVMYDFYLLYGDDYFFTRSKYLEYISSITTMHKVNIVRIENRY
jgi:hypothetical protein